jgi:hypothetical protein
MRAKIMSYTLALALAAGLPACDDEQEYAGGDAPDCGEGDAFSLEGEDFCLYRAAIIEEGFQCPPALARLHDFGDFIACAQGDLPPAFEGSVRERPGYQEPVNNGIEPQNNGVEPANNGIEPANNGVEPANNGEPVNTGLTGDCAPLDSLAILQPSDFTLVYDGPGEFDSEDPARHKVLLTEISQGSYGDFIQRAGINLASLPPVDLDAMQVFAAGLKVNSTCGLQTLGYGYYQTAEGPWLHAQLADPSGLCESVCEAEGSQIVIIAVERTGQPIRLCHELRLSCGLE